MKEYHSNATLALQSAGVKPSPQRVAILQWLIDNRCHPTVDEIYRALEQIYPTLSRTTVYNTMWLLAEAHHHAIRLQHPRPRPLPLSPLRLHSRRANGGGAAIAPRGLQSGAHRGLF
jgi:hypothetical protein